MTPLFLLRDGSKRELNVVPSDLKLESYVDKKSKLFILYLILIVSSGCCKLNHAGTKELKIKIISLLDKDLHNQYR